jgi:hypothetical protein
MLERERERMLGRVYTLFTGQREIKREGERER